MCADNAAQEMRDDSFAATELNVIQPKEVWSFIGSMLVGGAECNPQ